jgi:hypothetical protein
MTDAEDAEMNPDDQADDTAAIRALIAAAP